MFIPIAGEMRFAESKPSSEILRKTLWEWEVEIFPGILGGRTHVEPSCGSLLWLWVLAFARSVGQDIGQTRITGSTGNQSSVPPSVCLDSAAATAKILRLTGNLGCVISSEIENCCNTSFLTIKKMTNNSFWEEFQVKHSPTAE